MLSLVRARRIALVLALAAEQVALPALAHRESPERELSVLVLRTPIEGMVRIVGGPVRLGSEVPEIAAAQRMCRFERPRERCEGALYADEMLAHDVLLSDFWLDRHEVTNGAYRRCVAAGVCRWPNDEGALRWTSDDQRPATLVTWHDAARYCRWRGGRLPTEAEWERAARGWSRRVFPWGDVYGPQLANHGRAGPDGIVRLDDGDGFAELAPVGSFPAGATREGVHDLAGNAAEWVSDWYADSYVEPEFRDPQGPAQGTLRVVRGGSFRDGRAALRGAARNAVAPSSALSWIGFRCAKQAP